MIAFSASRSAAVAKSVGVLSKRAMGAPYIARSTRAPAVAAEMATWTSVVGTRRR